MSCIGGRYWIRIEALSSGSSSRRTAHQKAAATIRSARACPPAFWTGIALTCPDAPCRRTRPEGHGSSGEDGARPSGPGRAPAPADSPSRASSTPRASLRAPDASASSARVVSSGRRCNLDCNLLSLPTQNWRSSRPVTSSWERNRCDGARHAGAPAAGRESVTASETLPSRP